MDGRLFGWPLILASFGLVFGLIVGTAAVSVLDVTLFSGPTGPAVGGIIGVVVGLYLEFGGDDAGRGHAA